jgi:hypothetical protein
MSPRLRLLVEGLLDPLVEERVTAAQALALLRGEAPAPAGQQGGRGGAAAIFSNSSRWVRTVGGA